MAHRHLPFFGFFFLGSLGVMSLSAQALSVSEAWLEGIPWISASQVALWSEVIESVALLGSLALFFWVVFGHLSRRFDAQADVFGCKLVSCGALECPPHFDLEDGALNLVKEPSGARSPARRLSVPSAFRSSSTPSPPSPARTASPPPRARGGTAASPAASTSCVNCKPTPPASPSSSAACAPSASCSRHSSSSPWPWRS